MSSNSLAPDRTREEANKSKGGATRRVFLGGGLFVGALALFGGLSWAFRSPEDLVHAVITRNLPDQRLPEADITDFARNFVLKNRPMRQNAMAVNGLRLVGPIVFSRSFQYLLPQKRAQLLVKFEREILTAFLFSTDFFEQGGKTWDDVSYLGYYDAYERPCSNPLVRFDQ
ncbi:MAG: hypothetical protein AAF530_20585 [Pseudomonadota bacterium]